MALNFNLMNTDLPGQIAGSFQQGYQGAQDRANVLAQRQQQRQVADMEMQNALRARQDIEAERAAYGSTDPMEVANRLRGAGLGKQAFDFESTLAKNQAERQKQKLEQAKTTADLFKKTASGVMSNPSQYRSVIEQFGKLTGTDVTNDLNEFDQIYATQGAEGVRKRAAAYALDADKLLPQVKTVDLGGVSRQLVIDPLTGEPVSSTDIKKTMAPGEAERINLERRRVQLQETNTNQIDRVVTDESGATRFFNKFGQEITPTGATGQPINIQGKGSKDKDATVSEQQAAYNLGRVLAAAGEVAKIAKEDPGALQPGVMEALPSSVGMSGTANLARNANRQIVDGAQRDALDALLVLATGAAYNKEQLEGQTRAYIPSFTDKAETIKAKQQRMANLIQSAKVRAGKAWTPEMETASQVLINPTAAPETLAKPTAKSITVPPLSSGAPLAPNIDALVKKYENK